MDNSALLSFIQKWNAVMPVIAREISRRQTNDLYSGKITLPQFIVMEFLSKEAAVKMSDLASFVNVTTAAATGIVDRLVRGGYVARAHDLKDRRIVKISLTGKGNEVLRKINAQREQIATKIFGKISQHEREEYLKILLRIQDILLQEKAA